MYQRTVGAVTARCTATSACVIPGRLEINGTIRSAVGLPEMLEHLAFEKGIAPVILMIRTIP